MKKDKSSRKRVRGSKAAGIARFHAMIMFMRDDLNNGKITLDNVRTKHYAQLFHVDKCAKKHLMPLLTASVPPTLEDVAKVRVAIHAEKNSAKVPQNTLFDCCNHNDQAPGQDPETADSVQNEPNLPKQPAENGNTFVNCSHENAEGFTYYVKKAIESLGYEFNMIGIIKTSCRMLAVAERDWPKNDRYIDQCVEAALDEMWRNRYIELFAIKYLKSQGYDISKIF